MTILIDEVGNLLGAIKRSKVIIDIVEYCEREYHDIRRIVPNFLPQRYEFLGRAVSRHPKIDNLNLLAIQRFACFQLWPKRPPESMLHGHMPGFVKRITQHVDTLGVGQCAFCVSAVTDAV